MPDRKEPRLEIDPVKPASTTERPASAPVTPKPDAATRPVSHVNPEVPNKPEHQPPPQSVEPPPKKNERVSHHTQPSEAATPNTSGSGASPLLVWLVLLLALASLAFGGWQYLRADQQQQSMQVLADRVQELEIRLSTTGQNLSEAGNSFSAQLKTANEQLKAANEKLKWADDEIHKLWRLANNQIRPNITGLQEQTKGLDERLNRAERQSTEVANLARSANDKATEAARNLQTQTETIKKDLTAMGQRLTEVTLATSTLDQRLRNQDQSSRVTSLTQKLEQLEQRVSRSGVTPELQQKMAEYEEILASLEASRSQLVSRVTRLMEDVQALQQAR